MKSIRFIAIMCIAAMLLPLYACDNTSAVTTAETVTSATAETLTSHLTGEITDAETETPTTSAPETEAHLPIVTDTELGRLTSPFWLQNTMYDECITMQLRADGSIYARTLFVPTRIISIKDVTLASEYKEGTDYTWEPGTDRIYRTENSSIEYFTPENLAGLNEQGEKVISWGDTAHGWTEQNPWDEIGRASWGNALLCISKYYYNKQIAITYEYEADGRTVTHTEYQGGNLPITASKLKSGEEVRVVFFGDSILEGCDASSRYGRAPYQPVMADLVSNALGAAYGSRIKCFNVSLGGKPSVWGADNAKSLVDGKRPDLVIIGFGMNDGTLPASSTSTYVRTIISNIKEIYPDCEFLVLDTIAPNPDAGIMINQDKLGKYMKKLAGESVAFISIFDVQKSILQYKDYASISGNNVNHPNDWFIRVYAMNILSALINYGSGEK